MVDLKRIFNKYECEYYRNKQLLKLSFKLSFFIFRRLNGICIELVSYCMKQYLGGVTLFKKLRKNDYNWAFKYIKEYNEMVAYYEKQLDTKNLKIKKLEKEIEIIKSNSKFKVKQKQISNKDIDRIKELKKQGKS